MLSTPVICNDFRAAAASYHYAGKAHTPIVAEVLKCKVVGKQKVATLVAVYNAHTKRIIGWEELGAYACSEAEAATEGMSDGTCLTSVKRHDMPVLYEKPLKKKVAAATSGPAA